MSAQRHGSEGLAPEDASPEQLRGSRARRGRRVVRWLVWGGLALLVAGFVVALIAQGPSVPATIVLSVGLIVEAAGLVAYRILFWASVYAKDKPATARRARKPGW